MPIIVTITKAPESVSVSESTKTFDEQGGSIGRGQNNAWVLDDPERFLSSCHCEFSSESGQFYITDLSTNGTFFNGSVNPMGKGTKLALNDGNVFALGDYEFAVSVDMAVQSGYSDPFASSSPPSGDDVFSSPSSGDGFGDSASPFGGGHVSTSDSLFSSSAEETDPLAALDKAQGGSQSMSADVSGGFSNVSSVASDPFQTSDPFAGPTHSDQADPLNQQVSWPNSVPEQSAGGIPDDWDDDLLSSSTSPSTSEPVSPFSAGVNSAQAVNPVTPAPQPSMPLTQPPEIPRPAQPAADPVSAAGVQNPQLELEKAKAMLAQQQANEKIQAELEILKQQMQSQQRGGQTSVSVDTSLVEAMGLSNKSLVDEEITQINLLVGEVMREMVSGLMQVLGSRSSIKNEFRMNVTTIQPVENNPLKFSANVDDALENMFIKQGNAYKKPVEAVKESFESIAEHQVAILAGIRAAFKGVIERFDPIMLEQRFAKQKKSGIIPGSQKAKNWELYLEYYNDLAGDIDNSFQFLFGDEFVQAYEDQLQKLTIARKSQKPDMDSD